MMPADELITSASMSVRVIEMLELAIGVVRDGEDALPEIDVAVALLKIEAGELPRSELDFIESMYVFDCDRPND